MITIKKTISIFVALLFIAGTSFAQKNKKDKEETKDPEKYKKLEEYYAAGKYADCIWKAEKWMENEKYMKDPELYLYPSMSYLGIYKDPDAFPLKKFPDFKNPLKDAISYFIKFKKHDKSGEAMEEHKAYADELKSAVIQQAIDYREKKDNSRTATIGKDMVKAFDKDEAMMILGGSYMLATNNLAEGMKATDSAMVIMKRKLDSKPVYNEDEQKALNEGFITYSDYMLTKKDNAKAKDAITLAIALLSPNDKLKAQAEKVEKGNTTK